jgi:hypothetical protein
MFDFSKWKPRLTILLMCAALAGCRPGAKKESGDNDGGGHIPRPDLRVKSLEYLSQIGLAYKQAEISGPVKGPADLQGIRLDDPRGKPYVIVWGVRPDREAGKLLAWEAEPDEQGGRCVLFVAGNAESVDEAKFQTLPKAAGSKR